MHDPATNTPERLPERVLELETLYMHLQRTVADLDQVIREQQQRITQLERSSGSLQNELAALAGSIVEERKPEDEKPPHY